MPKKTAARKAVYNYYVTESGKAETCPLPGVSYESANRCIKTAAKLDVLIMVAFDEESEDSNAKEP